MLISEGPITKPLQDNSILKLRMAFPEEVDGKSSLELEASSVWCRTDINPDLYAIGLQITRLQPEVIQMIEQLIQMYRD